LKGDSNRRTILILAILSLAFGAHAFCYNYSTDDAFITFRYVRNMLDGNGLVYNPGERVEGYTNFLWAMLVAGPTSLGANITRTAKALGLLSGIGTLLAVFLVMRSCAAERYSDRATKWMVILPSALLAANGGFAMWSLGGLETLFFTFLLSLVIYVYLKARGGAAMYLCGLLFALLVMTRPDGVIFLAATVVHMGIVCVFFRSTTSGKPSAWDLGRVAVVFLVVYVPYFAWRYSYYGYLLPNTFYAKVGAAPAVSVLGPMLRGLKYSWRFTVEFGPAPILAAAAWILARVRRGSAFADANPGSSFTVSYLFFQIAACIAFILYVGGDQLVMHRFFVPVLPSLYLLTALGFSEMTIQKEEGVTDAHSRSKRTFAAAFCLGAVVLTCLPTFFGQQSRRVFKVEKPADADRKMVGEWLKQSVGPNTKIALIPAGIIPFYSELETIDLVGLNDVRIAHTEVNRFGKGEPGHEKHDSAYVLERRPDIMFLGACRLQPRRLSADHLREYYWAYGRLVPGNREMLGLEGFRLNYSPFASKIGSGYVHFYKREGFYMSTAEPLAQATE
jgi:hypothetical protein